MLFLRQIFSFPTQIFQTGSFDALTNIQSLHNRKKMIFRVAVFRQVKSINGLRNKIQSAGTFDLFRSLFFTGRQFGLRSRDRSIQLGILVRRKGKRSLGMFGGLGLLGDYIINGRGLLLMFDLLEENFAFGCGSRIYSWVRRVLNRPRGVGVVKVGSAFLILKKILFHGRFFVEEHLNLVFKVLKGRTLRFFEFGFILFIRLMQFGWGNIHIPDFAIEQGNFVFQLINVGVALAGLIHTEILLTFPLIGGHFFPLHMRDVVKKGRSVLFVFLLLHGEVYHIGLMQFLRGFGSHVLALEVDFTETFLMFGGVEMAPLGERHVQGLADLSGGGSRLQEWPVRGS